MSLYRENIVVICVVFCKYNYLIIMSNPLKKMKTAYGSFGTLDDVTFNVEDSALLSQSPFIESSSNDADSVGTRRTYV